MGVALYTALLLVVREHVIFMPSITVLGTAGMKLMNFLPLIVCLAVLLCLERRLGPAELTGVRRVVAADRALVLVTGGAVLLVGLAAHGWLNMPTATAAGRNVLFLTGLALLVRSRFGAAVAASVAVGWLFLTAAAGLRTPQDPYPWAVLLEPPGHLLAAVATIGMTLLGVLALGHEPPRR
ncbi:hypothetical protein [Streptomyces sp. NPDC003077]|uniref:hypothetical protein n=1 Tax=Streptomyces sp. NPDC003077 TaxID=3154443 RepID=UPI0033B75ED1